MADSFLSRPRIAPFAVALAAAQMTWRGFDTLLRLGWVAALVSTLAGIVLEPPPPHLSADGSAVEFAPGTVAMLVLLGIIAMILQSVVAVAWHRAILLGEHNDGRRWYLRLGGRELLYALISFFLLMLAAMASAVILPAALDQLRAGAPVLGLFFLAGPLVAIIVLARVVLVLPAVALGRPPDLARCWQAVDGNTARVASVLLIVATAAGAVGVGLIWVFTTVNDRNLGFPMDAVITFVNALASFTLMAFVLSALSLLYALLVDPSLRDRLPVPAESLLQG